MGKFPKRKPTRLKEYDYSAAGYYFVTVCAYNQKEMFGNIIDSQMHLNNAGQMVDQILQTLPEYYPCVAMDYYIVMPNHIHAIIQITGFVGDDPCVVPLQNGKSLNNGQVCGNGRIQRSAPTLSNIIQRFKMITTKKYIDGVKNDNLEPFNKHLWQRNYYDHVIRNEKSLQEICEYIVNNPAKWNDDEYNVENYELANQMKLA